MRDNPLPRVSNGFDTVCFDFDNTLAKKVWPDPGIGEDIPEGVDMMKRYAAAGYAIAIYTARPWRDQEIIEDWVFDRTGITADVHCAKPSAGLYIDDLAHRPYYAKETA